MDGTEGRMAAPQSYTPPPSQFGSGGFRALSSTAVLEREAETAEGEGSWIFDESESTVDVAATAEPLRIPQGPRPARAVNWRGFDDVILGSEDSNESPEPSGEWRRDQKLAKASFIVSLLGIVTGIGFLIGALMGHLALRRLGRCGWFSCNQEAERQARNAVMVGHTGMALIVAAVVLAGAWWLIQTPLESLLPNLLPAEGAVQETGAPQ